VNKILPLINEDTATLFENVAMASTGEDPRSEQACDKMVDREAFQDSRTGFDSNIPDSNTGSQKDQNLNLNQMKMIIQRNEKIKTRQPCYHFYSHYVYYQ